MPIRSYQCPDCGQMIDDLYWNQYPRSIPCPRCSGKAKYRIADTHYKKWGDRQPKKCKVMFRSGFDPGAGKWFDTQKDRDTWLRETDSTFRRDMF